MLVEDGIQALGGVGFVLFVEKPALMRENHQCHLREYLVCRILYLHGSPTRCASPLSGECFVHLEASHICPIICMPRMGALPFVCDGAGVGPISF